MEALHGQGATTTWVWERGQGGDLAENILTRANCVHAFGRVALDLQRLAPQVHALSQAKAQVAILYAYSSLLPSMDYYREVNTAFEGAYFDGALTDFVSERQIENGNLAQYKIIIVPRASHAPDSVVKALNEFIGNGGIVLTVGPCFTHDEYGRKRSASLAQSGRGRLVAHADPLTAHSYRDLLDRLLDEAGVGRPARLERLHGKPIWGVNLRSVEHDGKLLVHLLNLSHESQQVQVSTKPAHQRALNLMDGKQINFPFSLPPLEPALLAIP
jgi:hypothetical protein